MLLAFEENGTMAARTCIQTCCNLMANHPLVVFVKTRAERTTIARPARRACPAVKYQLTQGNRPKEKAMGTQ